ncbi:MAG: hypothetical protein ABW360_07800 [Phenylobacterium sp.]
MAFVLDLIRVGRGDRDLLDTLISVAIVQANVAPLLRDADLQKAYAADDEAPPDELRRPVSMNAIAHSLVLPYETVRRRVTAMTADGICEMIPGGVIISSQVLSSPGHRQVIIDTYDLVRRFYLRLRQLGELAGLPEPVRPWDPAADTPVRMVVRCSSDYVLRLVDLLTRHIGDLIAGVVFLDILRANTERLPDSERGGPDAGPSGFVHDAHRQPVRVATLAGRLDIPQETVRRHAAQLLKDDRCERVDGGLIIPSRVLARPNVVQMMRDNHASLYRLYAHLAQLGIGAEWERQAAQTAATR